MVDFILFIFGVLGGGGSVASEKIWLLAGIRYRLLLVGQSVSQSIAGEEKGLRSEIER
jgi:hypothetical protein